MHFARYFAVYVLVNLSLNTAVCAPKITLTSTSINPATPLYNGYPRLSDQYGCLVDEDVGISPQLSWTNFPKNTKYFALLVYDPDVSHGIFYHWGLYNIPKSMTALAEDSGNIQTGGIKQTRNDFSTKRYEGPCPPARRIHRYYFKVFALKGKLSLPSRTTSKQLKTALAGRFKKQVLATGTLIAVYPDPDGEGYCLNAGRTWSCHSEGDQPLTCYCKE